MSKWENFQIEIELLVNEQAKFSDHVTESVSFLGWDYEQYPNSSDYLLQMFIDFLSTVSDDGIKLRSMSIGKKIVYLNHVNASEVSEWTLCNCKCGCETPLSFGTCVDCVNGTHQNKNNLPQYEYLATLFDFPIEREN